MNKSQKKVAIIVPVYKTHFNKNEKLSLLHLEYFLNKYDKYFIMPEKLINKVKRKSYRVKAFPDKYFTGVIQYSELLNSKDFYLQFKDFEYILVYQLDALVFSDQLLRWCNKGYDYVGAPWFSHKIGTLSHQKGLQTNVGNGGFSLRKVSSFLKVIDEAEKIAIRKTKSLNIRKLWFILAILTGNSHKKWLNAPPGCYPFNEDGFWSIEAPKYIKGFKIAPFNEALKFAFEKEPKKCFNLNNNNLPFGCHAWFRYDKKFWLPYLLSKSRAT